LKLEFNDVLPVKRKNIGFALGILSLTRNLLEFVEIVDRKGAIKPFRMSKYPITNSLFKEFIDAGGYSNDSFWSSTGWQVKKNNQWECPLFWLDDNFNHPHHPVVGVSYYEAEAFATWQKGKLPTKHQWELVASRGDDKNYVWGKDLIVW